MKKIKITIFTRLIRPLFNYLFFIMALIPFTHVNAIDIADVVSFEIKDIDEQNNEISVKLVTKDNFKIYQDNLSFEFATNQTFPEISSYTTTPEAKFVFDTFSNKDKYIFENGTDFKLYSNISLKQGAKFLISVQACSSNTCLLPSTLALSIEQNAKSEVVNRKTPLILDSSIAQNAVLDSATLPPLTAKKVSLSELILKYLKNGSIFLFPLLFLAGLLTNLTPCVYPMIPITLSVMNQFGKNQKSQFQLACIYVGGMVITYSFLGVGAGMTGRVFGSQLASPFFNAVIASIMILLGLAMLGFFDLSFLQRLSYKIPFAKKSPVLAVGTMGAVSGLVAAPCTGPILSVILILISQTHNPVTGFVYMLCFTLGLGVPYIFLGLLSQKLANLPKMHRISGVIKLIFACLIFALALYFLKSSLLNVHFLNVFYMQPGLPTVIAVIALLLVFTGIKKSKFKFFTVFSEIGVVTVLTLLCLWLTLWLSDAFSAPTPSLSSSTFQEILETSEINWETNLNVANQKANQANKKVLVDVWADWCTACLEMEKTTWKDPKIIKIIHEKYIPVKLDYTSPSKELSDQLDLWHIVGLPAILLLNPVQNSPLLEVNQGIISTRDLLEQLKKY